jgi:hypothetical protein
MCSGAGLNVVEIHFDRHEHPTHLDDHLLNVGKGTVVKWGRRRKLEHAAVVKRSVRKSMGFRIVAIVMRRRCFCG